MAMHKPGDLVWAKMRGFPAWPAKVVSAAEADLASCPEGKHPVLFFGTQEVACMKPMELFSYAQKRDVFERPTKVRGFSEAIKAIRLAAGLSIEPDFDAKFVPTTPAAKKKKKVVLPATPKAATTKVKQQQQNTANTSRASRSPSRDSPPPLTIDEAPEEKPVEPPAVVTSSGRKQKKKSFFDELEGPTTSSPLAKPKPMKKATATASTPMASTSSTKTAPTKNKKLKLKFKPFLMKHQLSKSPSPMASAKKATKKAQSHARVSQSKTASASSGSPVMPVVGRNPKTPTIKIKRTIKQEPSDASDNVKRPRIEMGQELTTQDFMPAWDIAASSQLGPQPIDETMPVCDLLGGNDVQDIPVEVKAVPKQAAPEPAPVRTFAQSLHTTDVPLSSKRTPKPKQFHDDLVMTDHVRKSSSTPRANASATPPVRKLGRPPLTKSSKPIKSPSKSSTANSKQQELAELFEEVSMIVEPIKHKQKTTNATATYASPVLKRGRGRPRKSVSVSMSESLAGTSTPVQVHSPIQCQPSTSQSSTTASKSKSKPLDTSERSRRLPGVKGPCCPQCGTVTRLQKLAHQIYRFRCPKGSCRRRLPLDMHPANMQALLPKDSPVRPGGKSLANKLTAGIKLKLKGAVPGSPLAKFKGKGKAVDRVRNRAALRAERKAMLDQKWTSIEDTLRLPTAERALKLPADALPAPAKCSKCGNPKLLPTRMRAEGLVKYRCSLRRCRRENGIACTLQQLELYMQSLREAQGGGLATTQHSGEAEQELVSPASVSTTDPNTDTNTAAPVPQPIDLLAERSLSPSPLPIPKLKVNKAILSKFKDKKHKVKKAPSVQLKLPKAALKEKKPKVQKTAAVSTQNSPEPAQSSEPEPVALGDVSMASTGSVDVSGYHAPDCAICGSRCRSEKKSLAYRVVYKWRCINRECRKYNGVLPDKNTNTAPVEPAPPQVEDQQQQEDLYEDELMSDQDRAQTAKKARGPRVTGGIKLKLPNFRKSEEWKQASEGSSSGKLRLFLPKSSVTGTPGSEQTVESVAAPAPSVSTLGGSPKEQHIQDEIKSLQNSLKQLKQRKEDEERRRKNLERLKRKGQKLREKRLRLAERKRVAPKPMARVQVAAHSSNASATAGLYDDHVTSTAGSDLSSLSAAPAPPTDFFSTEVSGPRNRRKSVKLQDPDMIMATTPKAEPRSPSTVSVRSPRLTSPATSHKKKPVASVSHKKQASATATFAKSSLSQAKKSHKKKTAPSVSAAAASLYSVSASTEGVAEDDASICTMCTRTMRPNFHPITKTYRWRCIWSGCRRWGVDVDVPTLRRFEERQKSKQTTHKHKAKSPTAPVAKAKPEPVSPVKTKARVWQSPVKSVTAPVRPPSAIEHMHSAQQDEEQMPDSPASRSPSPILRSQLHYQPSLPESRSRWWLTGPKAMKMKRVPSPPVPLGVSPIEAATTFRLIARSYDNLAQQIRNKSHSSEAKYAQSGSSQAAGALDNLMDGLLSAIGPLLSTMLVVPELDLGQTDTLTRLTESTCVNMPSWV